MTTVEKLLVQIFERKKSIVEQVNHQTELYIQYLASKSLLDGITPPSWLWNPNTSDSQELNKDQLITKIFYPQVQSSARWSFGHYPGYGNVVNAGDNVEIHDGVSADNSALHKVLNQQDDSPGPAQSTDECALKCAPETDASFMLTEDHHNLIIAGDNVESRDGISTDNPAFRKVLEQLDDSTVPTQITDECALNSAPEPDSNVTSTEDHSNLVIAGDNVEFQVPAFHEVLNIQEDSTVPIQSTDEPALNCLPELDTRVTSPEGHSDERILKIYNAPDQSVVGSKRSKSRQKAIELRSSSKAQDKSGLRHDNVSDVFSSQIRFSLSATELAGQNDELQQLAENCAFGGQSCEEINLEEADHINSLPEPDTSVMSPEGHSDERILRIYNAPDQSLLGIKRSKSRQKALELRSSSKARDKSGLRHDNVSDVSSQIKFSLSATELAGQNDELQKLAENCALGGQSCEEINLDEADHINRRTGEKAREFHSSSKAVQSDVRSENIRDVISSQIKVSLSPIDQAEHNDELPQLAEPCAVGGQSYEEMYLDEDDCTSREMGMVSHSDLITSSRSRAEVPVSVMNCLTLDCSTEGCKEKSVGHVANSMRTESMPSPYSEHADNYIYLPRSGGISAKCRQSYGEKRLYDADFLGKNNEATSYTGKITRSEISRKRRCVDAVSDLVVSPSSPKVDACILASSSMASARQVNDSAVVSKSSKPSVGLFRRVTRSQTLFNEKETCKPANNGNSSFRGAISMPDCRRKSDEEDQNSSSGQSAPVCYGTRNMLHDDKNGSSVIVSELVSYAHVDQPCSSNSRGYVKQIKELESQVAPILSDSFLLVEPKQLDCKKTEDNLEAFTSKPAQNLKSLTENLSYSLSIPDVSLDKGICGGTNQLSLGKQSPGKSEGDKTLRDSFESDVQENRCTHAETSRPELGDSVFKAPEDYSDGLKCKCSDAHDEEDNKLQQIVDIDIRINPVKVTTEQGCASLPNQDMDEGNGSSHVKGKAQLLSGASEIKNSDNEPIALDEINSAQQVLDFSCGEDEVCASRKVLGTHSTVRVRGDHSPLESRLRHTNMESWPQLKRKKIEHQQDHSFTTSPNFREKKQHLIPRDAANTYLNSMDTNVDTYFQERVKKSSDVRTIPEMNTCQTEGKSSFLSKNGKVGSCHNGKNEHKTSSSDINSEQLDVSPVSSLPMNESTHRCFVKEIRTPFSSSNLCDARMSGNEQCSGHLGKNIANLNSESLHFSNILLEGAQSPKWGCDLYTEHSVLSPSNEDLKLGDVDQSIPEFEGFIVDAQTNGGELNFSADKFHFNELNLPRTTLERASILAEICRSASLDRTSYQFSSSFEFQETQNLSESVPNGGYLEHLDLGDPLCSDVGKHLQSSSSSSDGYMDATDVMPYSVSLAYSGAKYGWNPRNQYASPVGKLWDRPSSYTGSSEKRLSSNPELTCFPIEEDASISEESKTVGENIGDLQEEIDSSLANHCDNRRPLKDLTNLSLNMPVSAEVETLKKDAIDIVSAKCSVSGTWENLRRGPKYPYRNKNGTSGKQTSSIDSDDGWTDKPSCIGANRSKKAKESTNNTSKSIVSSKTSLKGQNQKLSLKESLRNNIISNVNSFIPLIQQKQASTICAGKRDVKVKSLEAAEASKRLEEKKANERKLRKEALKLDRAKLEEKNLKIMELEKKKKEEERKKKEADNMSKKRLREEEERKEKERKRARLESRQQQKEIEEKRRAEKAEKDKENHRSKAQQINSKKESHNEHKKQLNKDISRGDGEIKLTLTGDLMNHKECSTSGISCEAEKAMHSVDQSPRKEDMIAQNNLGKSYEISPYQCSDDEEDEEDELPTNKYIPSWASKTSVALFLPLQQKLDPDVIFQPESFCSMDEVLLPRNPRKSQVAS